MYYLVHNSLTLIPLLNQKNPLHILSNLLQIHTSICIQCEYITSTQLVQFSLVFYCTCIYSYMFRPHYLAIFRLSVRCSYIVPLYYIILYYIVQLFLYYNYLLPYEISYFRALWVEVMCNCCMYVVGLGGISCSPLADFYSH
jgi:hypothetical protein